MSEIIVTFGDELRHQTIGNYDVKVAYISLPKKRGTGYLKTPIGHHINERTILIDDLGLNIDDVGNYWFSVYLFDKDSGKGLINDLLIELSKLHKTTYKIVGWDAFWDFIDDLMKVM